MISMKLTPAEAKAETMLAAPSDAPEYPYGLTICLDDDVLAKLGITDLSPVGAVFMLTARVEVCSTSQYQNQDGTDKSMSLQITDMDLDTGDAPRSTNDIANRLYG
ncbi:MULTISPECIES: capsid staple protein [unclassified Caballeronia]|uniref:capsid staple protein n=1 Tax=unclassified Caballeronia TaxID=2646786 RepID=UPI00285B5D97|nr:MULTISPECIES: hypothetical protein [unclassified Caballeronia]MDR5772086.1 hypothetical protein [Caballeronia sp. LZ002]MDR5847520.1 hypothetical protein [Caballeronia sp. LZ003]